MVSNSCTHSRLAVRLKSFLKPQPGTKLGLYSQEYVTWVVHPCLLETKTVSLPVTTLPSATPLYICSIFHFATTLYILQPCFTFCSTLRFVVQHTKMGFGDKNPEKCVGKMSVSFISMKGCYASRLVLIQIPNDQDVFE